MFIRALTSNRRCPLAKSQFKLSNKRDFPTEVQYKQVFRASNELGIKSDAIYSKEDLGHVPKNESYNIAKGLPPIASNLNIPEITRMCVKNNIGVVHPGHGFFSKKSEFGEDAFTSGMEPPNGFRQEHNLPSALQNLLQCPLVIHGSVRFYSNSQMQPTTEYDIIVDEYSKIRSSLKMFEIFDYTMFKEIKFQLSGKSVIDVACGNGITTRLLKKMGAGKTVGVDISKEMIVKALHEEKINPLGIEYIQTSVEEMNIKSESFDIAISYFLLHYAKNKMQLRLFLKNIYSILKKDGMFLSIHNNIHKMFYKYPRYLQEYGLIFKIQEPLQTGSPITLTLSEDDVNVDLYIYYYTIEDLKEAVKMAGFTEVEFLPLEFPEYMKGAPYWDKFLQYTPAHLMICKK